MKLASEIIVQFGIKHISQVEINNAIVEKLLRVEARVIVRVDGKA